MSKGKEKTNGSAQKVATMKEPSGGRADGQQRAPTDHSRPEPAARSGDPFPNERRFGEELDRVFEGFGIGSDAPDFWPSGSRRDEGACATGLGPDPWAPPVEVLRRGDRLTIRIDLPGLSKEEIHVEVAKDMITIQGERRQEHEERREGYFQSECCYGSFLRNILLPEGAEADKAEASFRDGVLEITLPAPAREASLRRRLEVKG
jgi:HSP20 family protein